ncbi:hypothetical protein DYU11_20000 [Fibrisoma montanum]|uniref:Uncharacterized protein n=1 Tax=Fibrisoma montanum TaxID=2305895 RepID=A0A418M3D1_9BACT|nr:hypothetical protein [Fibrisoma montanum]RIV20337.1 hypothetical protein DYU11_20000 [Fibrisoma montanum]
MATDYIEIAETKNGTTVSRYYPVDSVVDCATGDSLFNSDSQKASKLLNSRPAAPAGFQWVLKDCSAGIPQPPGSTEGFGTSYVQPSASTQFMDLALRWVLVDGAWWGEVYERQTSRQPDAGNRRMWWLDGQTTPVYDSFSPKLYAPGTRLSVYYGEGPTNSLFGQGFTSKAQQSIYIGNPNT